MRDLIVVIVGRVLQILTSLLVLRLATNRLDPDEFGALNLLFISVMLMAFIFVNPIGMYINRRMHGWYERGLLNARLLLALAYLIPICVVSGLLAMLADSVFDFDWKLSTPWVGGLIAFSLLCTTSNQTLIPGLNMLERRVSWSILTLFSLWTGLAFAWYFTTTEPSANLWLLGIQCGSGIGAILSIPVFIRIGRRAPKPRFDVWSREKIRIVWAFVVPLAVAVSLNWFQFQSYRFFMGEIVSLEFLGFFAAGYAVSGGILVAFENSAQQFYYPIFYRRIHQVPAEGRVKVWQEYVSGMIPLTWLTTVMILAAAQPLTMLLVDEKYHEVAPRFVITGAIVEFARALGNVYGLAAHSSMKTRVLFVPHLIGTVFVLVGVGVGGSWHPAASITLVLPFAAVMYLLTMHHVITRHVNARFGLQHLWAIPTTSLATVALLGIGWWSWSTTHNLGSALGVLTAVGCVYLLAGARILILGRARSPANAK